MWLPLEMMLGVVCSKWVLLFAFFFFDIGSYYVAHAVIKSAWVYNGCDNQELRQGGCGVSDVTTRCISRQARAESIPSVGPEWEAAGVSNVPRS